MNFTETWDTVTRLKPIPEEYRSVVEFFFMAGRLQGIEDALRIEVRHAARTPDL
jgi:hypothetical protein